MKKRFRYTFLLLIYVVLLISACVKREWYNPFDPACPKELWTPTNFQAVQEGDLVKLTWVRPTANISGFKIIRQVDDGPAVSLTNQAKDVIELKDGNLTGGKVHTYSITAFAGNNESNAVSIQVKPLFIPSFST